MKPFLELRDVTKTFAGGKIAADHISIAIPKGCIYGMLGPNGAGKTTTIRMITQITQPDQGEIRLDGHPVTEEDQNRIGYLPEERGLYRKMKVREHLIYLLRIRGTKKKEAEKLTDEWMEKFEIADWRDKKIQELSKGMQQKVQFISTIAHGPELLILDEPFSGLDPVNTEVIEQEIREQVKKGVTIIFSTHRMEQVEEMCERIALINHGKVILEDEMRNIRHDFSKNEYELEYSGDASVLMRDAELEVTERAAGKVLIQAPEGLASGAVLQKVAASGIDVLKFNRKAMRLQEIFIQKVKEEVIHG